MKKVLFAAVALVFAVSCNTAPKTTETEAAQAKAEAEEKARQEKLANPTTEDLLKEIRDLLKKQ